ncbi:ferric-chelate reductase Frp1 [Pleosporales sp. CAS-2024a]
MDMSMSMSMGSLPGVALYDFPKIYWTLVGSAIAVATLVNLYNHILYRQRLSAAQAKRSRPAKPSAWLTLATACIYALMREASNYALFIPLKNRTLRLPSVGRVSLVLANAITLIVLCLYGLDLTGRFTKEDVAFRCGIVTLGQIPLVFLLAGRNNMIGWLSGVSYERLNWLHRWCARTMLLTTTLHMGYFFASWNQYDYIPYQLKHNVLAWRGLAAWSTLVWIVFSSIAPIRGWSYEVFVVQHLVSYAVFIGFVFIHIPVDIRGYVWAPVALFFLDRVIRAARLLYCNVLLFHPKQRQSGQSEGLLACKAEFTPLPHNTTRVVIRNPPITWTPGQHVFLSCHSIAPLQSHPFTIASVPSSGTMEFLIKSEKGGTKRFFKHASKFDQPVNTHTQTVTIEGPYGCIRPLRQFDSVVLLAGSTGVTFTLPLLRDIVQGWEERASTDTTTIKPSLFQGPTGAVTRHVRFVWVVKSRAQMSWLSTQLGSIADQVERLQDRLRDIKLELTVYVTCDEAFSEEHTASTRGDAVRREPGHELVEYRSSTGWQHESMGGKEDMPEQVVSRPATSCRCRQAVDEPGPSSANAVQCCCCSSSSSNASSSALMASRRDALVHGAIALYAGRPKTRDIIRRSLEQALGESGVVVCGPHGLVADVKRHVCALSEERAVHKGTGAQGVYLHTESFHY